ncbi:MAG: c-type cytochrome [Pseudoduganella sp.]|nr:c-type cytochrome [Pseudoduganella sp.]
MKIAISALLISTSLAAHADTPEQLAKSKSCFACHATAKKLVGPSFKDIAVKYKNDKTAEDKLVLKILQGGSGVWGAVPMPPNQVTDAEAHQLVRWVLAQK